MQEEFFKNHLGEELSKALAGIKITSPTPIQESAVPLILENKDVIGISETGSGKTFAYLLPILKRLDAAVKAPQAVILTPTHELASQVYKQAQLILKESELKPALIIGGANLSRQLEALKLKPRIIIGSAGRILELNKMRKLTMHSVKTIVLDEADRLLDEHNLEAVKNVIKTTLKDRQLLFFSATMSESALAAAKELAKEPHAVKASGVSVPENIEHIYFVCEMREKTEVLRKIAHAEGIKKAIVFINNQNAIELTAKRLCYHGIEAGALYGAALKRERRQALENFRNGKTTLLVASDLGARGLDIEGLTHIFNLDVPENPAFYLHRAGRTGRMGNKGTVITLATPAEVKHIKNCERKLGIKINKRDVRYGKIINDV